MDAALALLHRAVLDESEGPIFLWCDSSPQLGTDWLLSIYDFIPKHRAVQCFHEANKVTSSVAAFRAAVDDMDPDEVEVLVSARVAACSALRRDIRRHRQMPMAIGSGAGTMPDKIKAVALKFCHETSDANTLRRVASQVQSFTVDLGVESGLSHAPGDIQDYLPAWVKVADAILPDDGLDIPEEEGRTQQVFPSSMVTAGLDHVSNNLQSDLDEHLQGWAAWLPPFKAVAHLLSHKYLLKRLVARCVAGTQVAALASSFETCVQSVAKWRWGTIVKALPTILDLLRPLSLVWDADKFMAKSQGPEHAQQDQDLENEALDVGRISEAVKSAQWKVYGQMILRLHQIANFISSWGSGCPCHHWPSTSNKYMQALDDALHSLGHPTDADGPRCACILAGKRAPEMATGRWKELMGELVEELRPQVLMDTLALPEQDQESILNDFEHGVSYVQMVLDIKLAHWTELPWQLCALATDVPGDRPEAAKRILNTFEKLPQTEGAHHGITWRFLRPGGELREQLRSLADDPSARLEELPELLYEALS